MKQIPYSLTIAKQAGNLYDKLIGILDSFKVTGTTKQDQIQPAQEIIRNRLVAGRGKYLKGAEA